MTKQRERLEGLIKNVPRNTKMFYDQYAEYLIQNGVVVLPCKVGDTVWSIADCGKEPLEFKVHEIIITKDRTIICLKGRRYRTIVSEALGKTIFFTKEEAEAALEEQRK